MSDGCETTVTTKSQPEKLTSPVMPKPTSPTLPAPKPVSENSNDVADAPHAKENPTISKTDTKVGDNTLLTVEGWERIKSIGKAIAPVVFPMATAVGTLGYQTAKPVVGEKAIDQAVSKFDEGAREVAMTAINKSPLTELVNGFQEVFKAMSPAERAAFEKASAQSIVAQGMRLVSMLSADNLPKEVGNFVAAQFNAALEEKAEDIKEAKNKIEVTNLPEYLKIWLRLEAINDPNSINHMPLDEENVKRLALSKGVHINVEDRKVVLLNTESKKSINTISQKGQESVFENVVNRISQSIGLLSSYDERILADAILPVVSKTRSTF